MFTLEKISSIPDINNVEKKSRFKIIFNFLVLKNRISFNIIDVLKSKLFLSNLNQSNIIEEFKTRQLNSKYTQAAFIMNSEISIENFKISRFYAACHVFFLIDILKFETSLLQLHDD